MKSVKSGEIACSRRATSVSPLGYIDTGATVPSLSNRSGAAVYSPPMTRPDRICMAQTPKRKPFIRFVRQTNNPIFHVFSAPAQAGVHNGKLRLPRTTILSTAVAINMTSCVVVFLLVAAVHSYNVPARGITRRDWLCTSVAGALLVAPSAAHAAADCFTDCMKNCKLIAPKDPAYCQDNCRDYCDQDDRNDGLSGSVSAQGGEVGILGGTFGTGTVVKGEDKPPVINLPGLDFSSGAGKKLIGYD